MTESKRFFVAKATGSRFAYVIDSFGERKPTRFDIFKGNGWADADVVCRSLNEEAEAIRSMTPEQTQAIREDAERAARAGKTPNEACPHPFSSEQGKLWVECYWLIRQPVHVQDAGDWGRGEQTERRQA
jgi:hypothetical protein